MIKKIVLGVMIFLIAFVGVKADFLQASEKYTIRQMTSDIRNALESRRARFDDLRQLKQQGSIGENNQGYLTIFDSDGNIKRIVDAENRDRRIIYEAIARQNNIEEAIDLVQKAFAKTQRDNAEPGDKIQLENGRWSVK